MIIEGKVCTMFKKYMIYIWFSPCTLVSSTNIMEILLKVVLSTITPPIIIYLFMLLNFTLNQWCYELYVFTGNTIVNSISVIPWQSVLLVEETGVQRNSLTNLSHKVLTSTPNHLWDSNLQLKW